MAAGSDVDGPEHHPDAPPVGEGAPRTQAPPRPVPGHVESLWGWAKGYIRTQEWTLAPIWMLAKPDPDNPSETLGDKCACPDGGLCAAPGKHLVSGLGVARTIEDVEEIWSVEDARVRGGLIGIAVMTGESSKLVVIDVRSGGHEITKARYGLAGIEVMTVETPSGGQHWFFELDNDEAVTGGRREVELVKEVWVLGDDAYVPLTPTTGYTWIGGAEILRSRRPGPMPERMRQRLVASGLLLNVSGTAARGSTHRDDPWRTIPGVALAGGDTLPRTYTRTGDIRRLVDEWGHLITWTPGLSWRVWTERGWDGPDRSEATIKTRISELPRIHLRESHELEARGKDDLSKEAAKWGQKSLGRASTSVLSDVMTDERILVPSMELWDSEGWIVGLPVRDGVGRVMDLRTGKVTPDARSRRVSRQLGVDWSGEAEHEIAWRRSVWFRHYLHDLEVLHGPEWIRLLQRAMGATLYGRKGVQGDLDAVFCLKGPARSGKSTSAAILQKVMGHYGAPMNENLLFGDKGNPEFVLAGIQGVRALLIDEPPANAHLNTSRLKALSGGDRITGRAPYGREQVTFEPEASLWLSTNHPLDIADDALWRRLKIFQFERSLAPAKVDPRLRKAVTEDPIELAAELYWILKGARLWAEEGWGSTAVWDDAVNAERAANDPIDRWLTSHVHATGAMTDTFTVDEALASLQGFMVMDGSDKIRMSNAALRDEVLYRVKNVLPYDKDTKKFVGGTCD